MYQVIIKTWFDGVRDMDGVFNKVYTKRGYAVRKAKELETDDGHLCRKAYVRGVLTPATVDDALTSYKKGGNVWVDGKYGKEKLTPSWHYGSHAPVEELFWRSANLYNYGYHYDGVFYIEYKA